MATFLSYTIDMPNVNEDGTIDVIDLHSCLLDYPFNWQYKIYEPFQSNKDRLLNMLFGRSDVDVIFTKRFTHYLESRKNLYEEASKKYLTLVQSILESDFSTYDKEKLIREIDLLLNKLYPYST